MSNLQSWLMVVFACIGSGVGVLLVRLGRQIVAAIRDVPQIVPLHHEAMSAIDEVKDEIVAIGVKTEANSKSLADIDARQETVELSVADLHKVVTRIGADIALRAKSVKTDLDLAATNVREALEHRQKE